MCNLYRMDDRDWVNKWAQDVESLINLMPIRSTRINGHPSSETPPTVGNSSRTADGACPLRSTCRGRQPKPALRSFEKRAFQWTWTNSCGWSRTAALPTFVI